MSLLVSIVSKDTNVNIEKIEKEIYNSHNELFGFESWRKEVWGNEIMESIGCNLLYSLSQKDVYVYDSDIQILKHELYKVIEQIETVSKVTRVNKEAIEFRVRNALEMVRVAEKHSDNVGIVIG